VVLIPEARWSLVAGPHPVVEELKATISNIREQKAKMTGHTHDDQGGAAPSAPRLVFALNRETSGVNRHRAQAASSPMMPA
jgi:hypothetical protein